MFSSDNEPKLLTPAQIFWGAVASAGTLALVLPVLVFLALQQPGPLATSGETHTAVQRMDNFSKKMNDTVFPLWPRLLTGEAACGQVDYETSAAYEERNKWGIVLPVKNTVPYETLSDVAINTFDLEAYLKDKPHSALHLWELTNIINNHFSLATMFQNVKIDKTKERDVKIYRLKPEKTRKLLGFDSPVFKIQNVNASFAKAYLQYWADQRVNGHGVSFEGQNQANLELDIFDFFVLMQTPLMQAARAVFVLADRHDSRTSHSVSDKDIVRAFPKLATGLSGKQLSGNMFEYLSKFNQAFCAAFYHLNTDDFPATAPISTSTSSSSSSSSSSFGQNDNISINYMHIKVPTLEDVFNFLRGQFDVSTGKAVSAMLLKAKLLTEDEANQEENKNVNFSAMSESNSKIDTHIQEPHSSNPNPFSNGGDSQDGTFLNLQSNAFDNPNYEMEGFLDNAQHGGYSPQFPYIPPYDFNTNSLPQGLNHLPASGFGGFAASNFALSLGFPSEPNFSSTSSPGQPYHQTGQFYSQNGQPQNEGQRSATDSSAGRLQLNQQQQLSFNDQLNSNNPIKFTLHDSPSFTFGAQAAFSQPSSHNVQLHDTSMTSTNLQVPTTTATFTDYIPFQNQARLGFNQGNSNTNPQRNDTYLSNIQHTHTGQHSTHKTQYAYSSSHNQQAGFTQNGQVGSNEPDVFYTPYFHQGQVLIDPKYFRSTTNSSNPSSQELSTSHSFQKTTLPKSQPDQRLQPASFQPGNGFLQSQYSPTQQSTPISSSSVVPSPPSPTPFIAPTSNNPSQP